MRTIRRVDLQYNAVDIALAVMLIVAVVRGWSTGALSQVASFGGAALGLVIGAVAAPGVAGVLVDGPGLGLAITTGAIFCGVLIAGQAVGVAIGHRLRHAAARAGLATFDRIVGTGISLIGLLVLIWLLGSIIAQGPFGGVSQSVRDSRVASAVDQAFGPAPDVFGRATAYLDQQGFPQVFSGIGGGVTAPPVPETSDAAVRAAAEAASASTVQIQGTGCGAMSSGSGFVTAPGFVVTNAHVVAGIGAPTVRDTDGQHAATLIHMDPDLDLAVLSAPDVTAPPIPWTDEPSARETEGATLGFPGGQRELSVKPATVRGRGEAVGRDIYGRGSVVRDVLTLAAPVVRGDSGGPFVTADGTVGGVVFAADAARGDTGYALTAERVRGDVEAAVAASQPVDAGPCRF